MDHLRLQMDKLFYNTFFSVHLSHYKGDGRVVRLCWITFQCRGVLVIWIIVVQGPTVFAVGVGGVVWTFFSLVYLFSLSSFSLSLGDGLIQTETLSQRAVKLKHNQPTNEPHYKIRRDRICVFLQGLYNS